MPYEEDKIKKCDVCGFSLDFHTHTQRNICHIDKIKSESRSNKKW